MFSIEANRGKSGFTLFLVIALLGCCLGILAPQSSRIAWADSITEESLRTTIEILSASGNRSTGSPGAAQAAAFIQNEFEKLGIEETGVHRFALPIRKYDRSHLVLPEFDAPLPLWPLKANAVTPETVPQPGIQGPVVYVANGELPQMNGKKIKDAIVLMELASGRNWINAASLGAKALIYIDRGQGGRTFYESIQELSPIRFPRFRLSIEEVRNYFGDPTETTLDDGIVHPGARLTCDMRWEEAIGENVYALIPGKDPDLDERMILVEAFYDATDLVAGIAPGADEGLSIAAMLALAKHLRQNPPKRAVLFVATAGHAETLAGMREAIWALQARSRFLRRSQREFKKEISTYKKSSAYLEKVSLADFEDTEKAGQIKAYLDDQIKTEVDRLSRELMRLRLEVKERQDEARIQLLADQRLLLRRIGWRTVAEGFSPQEARILHGMIPEAVATLKAKLADSIKQAALLKSTSRFRSLAKSRELDLAVSLHLSSHGDGLGAFNQGWLYPLRPGVSRVSAYAVTNEVLGKIAARVESDLGLGGLYQDTLQPSRLRSWQSYFIDQPQMGGEVSALASYIGLTFATTSDARSLWGTPLDTPDRIDWTMAVDQSRLVTGLVAQLADAPKLHGGIFPRNGFGAVTGRANFLRQGELFADQPAPGSLLLAYQNLARYYTFVDANGRFTLKGVSEKRSVFHKVIIEGYRFDPDTGRVIWAIDKKQTGKEAYRVKMNHRFMDTSLVMFGCRQTTILNLLEPRNFSYMTKPQLIDARLEAPPIRFWYSRIDTWKSLICSIYLDPGTRLKMTLSDSILTKKMILTNGDAAHPLGQGYRMEDWPLIGPTEYRTAKDMWALLEPRIENLEARGIHDERIAELHQRGSQALEEADEALAARSYDSFFEASRKAWALASRVYDQVEKVQKDVLFGVLFYIALFVPFAFCAERLLFSYRNIYKRIMAFLTILILLIMVIYNVHPAFQLAYSPMVVILAFFIIGLSVMVAMIIFLRFEEEMILLQRRARKMRTEEISMWKAFAAAFFLGVSNLRRRRLRTILTCCTLIILTFTIMSFTSVKSTRHHARVMYRSDTPYAGFQLKNLGWQELPPEALQILTDAFEGQGITAPRVWLEAENRTRPRSVPVRHGDQSRLAQGLMGLSAEEPLVSGIDKVLVQGRWHRPGETDTVILPERMARDLGVSLDSGEVRVALWGTEFRVVGTYSAAEYAKLSDLDGEMLTPVTYPQEATMAMTEVEVDALESGEDLVSFQSRYQHVAPELTLILPHETLLAAGGHLKSVAIGMAPEAFDRDLAHQLVDRFGLALFSGEASGTYLYNASDTLNYSGVPNIIIPLIISIFIVLNTMIGSVYERKREIGIYTSVGLAPMHVSFLFIAEAMAFAVLSVVLGYVLAQTAATLFSQTALWSGITVNYSSLAGVAAMFLVMLVVVISAIYPSKVAARIAIPDVKKSWTMPLARDNRIEVILPFLMKAGEDHSAAGFLYDYFDGHMDVSHGNFSTGDVTMARVANNIEDIETAADGPQETHKAGSDGSRPGQDNLLQLNSMVWLAPFDFGIMQEIEVLFRPSLDEPGFMEIRIAMLRRSGEINAWRRINRNFIHRLRKHLLVWRSLDDDQKAEFERLALEAV